MDRSQYSILWQQAQIEQMTVSVFLADDHAVVRDGLRFLLDAESDITVVGTAPNGRQAVQQVIELQPNVVIMDITMPELNGIEATYQICHTCPSTQVVILTMHAKLEYVILALQSGARGYLLKESAGVNVVNAVHAVVAGEYYLSQKISDMLIDDFVSQCNAVGILNPLSSLSPREREILQLIVEGKSSLEIASILSLSPKTIETHRSRLMQKLRISDLPSLVKFAIQRGLVLID